MYRFHVAIADLLPPASGEHEGLPRLPVFERLLAAADVVEHVPDWRRWALSRLGCKVEGEVPALAALLADSAGIAVTGSRWFVLTPLHLVAGMTTVHHHAAGPVVLDHAVAEQLVAGLKVDFKDADLAFHHVRGIVLLGVCGELAVRTQDPSLLAGRALSQGLAEGEDARRLARLCGEFELWLHGRNLRGRDGRAVHALHPWANGDAAIERAACSPQLLSDDPFLRAACAGQTDPTSVLDVWSVADLLATGVAFADAETRWVQPLVARLQDGEIASAQLHVAGRTYALRRSQRWRVWRRPRPWWELLS
jgi:hypothetical protein